MGGSAGAVEVLQRLASTLTASFAPAMVVILHMPPDSREVLHTLLAAPSRPPMKVAEDKEPIAPGSVYFAAPGYHLLVESDGTFALSLDELVHFSRPSIDVLFESAAELYRDRLLGIILTGANTDGASGLAAVHRAGGLTIVQQPETAHSAVMVESALRWTPVDFVLSLGQIADLLRTLDGDGR